MFKYKDFDLSFHIFSILYQYWHYFSDIFLTSFGRNDNSQTIY
jgi:hypothetical protein